MAKKIAKSAAAAATAAPATVQLDWNEESARIIAMAKEKPGTRGAELAKIGGYIAGNDAGAAILRAAASREGKVNGAQAFAELSRNTLSKLRKLSNHVAAGIPWCSPDGLLPDNRRKEDASVAIALGGLIAGDARQKAVIAQAMKRYPGGAQAQMGAALDACTFIGIVNRTGEAGSRNADYSVADESAVRALVPAMPATVG